MIHFIYLPWKSHLLSLFWWIWMEGNFLFIDPKTNFIKIFIPLWSIDRVTNNWKLWGIICKELYIKSLDYLTNLWYIISKKLMEQELNPEAYPHLDSYSFRSTLSCLSNKKSSIKVRRSPLHPYILSYKWAFHTTLDQ